MKVGKAIYNILSQSTDVQSNFPFNTTDYAPTGTELVTNGDFSATGGELITNGDFSATGAELITNGDFATSGTPTTTSWSLGWAQTGGSEDGSNITGGELVLTLPDGEDSNYNRVYATNGSSAITGVVEVGKSYKLTYTVTAVTGSPTFKYINGGAYADAPTSLETHVIYYVCTVTDHFGLRNSGNDSSITLDNVSIKELGEGWTINDGWSIGEDKAIWDADSAIQNENINQGISFGVDKSYKVTFTIGDVVGSPVRVLMRATGVDNQDITDSWESLTAGTYTRYFTSLYANAQFDISGRYDAGDSFSITSITVEELGEGWTVQDGWSIGENKAIADGTGSYKQIYQFGFVPTSPVSKTFKISIKIEDWVSGGVTVGVGGYDRSGTLSGNGTYEEYVTVNNVTGNKNFYVVTWGTFVGSITNITVQEMALTKIFPELAPPDIDAPYVVYSVVSNSPSETKNTNGDIDTASIEVYGFQDTYNKAVDLGVSVRAALDRKTGTYNTIEIQSTNYVNEQMDVNEARKLWAAIQDYSIRIKNI